MSLRPAGLYGKTLPQPQLWELEQGQQGKMKPGVNLSFETAGVEVWSNSHMYSTYW